jgi:hypothetical protein
MAAETIFSPSDVEKMGVLVNNIGIYASQIVHRNRPDFTQRALANLGKLKKEEESLLKRLDQLARKQNDESPLRLIEDLATLPSDMAQMMSLIRRCLSASAFLGHCIAIPSQTQSAAAVAGQEKRLH